MKTLGVETNGSPDLTESLDRLVDMEEGVSKIDTYYFVAISFTDIPVEESNIWIHQNAWFVNHIIDENYIRSIELDLLKDEFNESIVDFFNLIKEINIKSLELKIYNIGEKNGEKNF
jgi:hypothetical protein